MSLHGFPGDRHAWRAFDNQQLGEPDPDFCTEVDLLRAALDYNPATGAFTWKRRDAATFRRAWRAESWNRDFAGKPAFCTPNKDGYLTGMFQNRQFKAHRVAWAVTHGVWPSQIDHINGCRSDNRLSNLREVTTAENQHNSAIRSHNSVGAAGVSYNKAQRKYRAFIMHHGVRHYLGAFDALEDAARARKDAERRFGWHPNSGRQRSPAP